jgi:MarR family transcriptional regulator, lower aerobic nicotinate degradation pathway regulator
VTHGTAQGANDSAGQVPPLLAHDLGFLLGRLGGECRRRLGDALADRGLAARHYAVLAVLEDRAPLPQRDLTATLGLDRSYVVGLVDQLEDAGLVERRPDLADRRRHALTLTAQGRYVASACRAVSNQVEEDLLAPLEPEDRSLLHALLHRVAAFHDARIPAE